MKMLDIIIQIGRGEIYPPRAGSDTLRPNQSVLGSANGITN